MVPPEAAVPVTAKELALLERIAKRDGVTVEEAARQLFSAALAQRVRRTTGKAPARVYSLGSRR